MLTPRQFAELQGVAYQTVMSWLQKDMVPGAKKESLPPPFAGHFYLIPADAPRPNVKPGPVPKKKATNAK